MQVYAGDLLIYKPIDPQMKEKKLILISLAIPVLFYITVEMRAILEYFFRMSEKYHYIYSNGSFFLLLVQMFLVFVSFYIGFYIVVNRRQFTWKTKIISILIGSSVFLYLVIGLGYVILRDLL